MFWPQRMDDWPTLPSRPADDQSANGVVKVVEESKEVILTPPALAQPFHQAQAADYRVKTIAYPESGTKDLIQRRASSGSLRNIVVRQNLVTACSNWQQKAQSSKNREQNVASHDYSGE